MNNYPGEGAAATTSSTILPSTQEMQGGTPYDLLLNEKVGTVVSLGWRLLQR
jgi:hypothetical protein